MILLQRIMAVLAAVFLVGAVAIALIGPPDAPLGAELYAIDREGVFALQRHVTGWLWDAVALPVLMRPAWLLPACIGILCGGLSLSLSTRQRPQRSTRRRF